MPPPDAEALGRIAAELGLALEPAASDKLLAYLALLRRWNATYNLTAVRDPQAMLTQHVADCMAVVPPLRRHLGGSPGTLLDVGSGGGLPGVVIAILCPDIEVTCTDAVAKKVAFVRQVAAELSLGRLHAEHGRVERGSGRFDVVASRAFATLAEFIALTKSRIGEQGAWLAMKGRVPTKEMKVVPRDIDVFHVEQLSVPGLGAARCIVWMRPT